LLTALDKGTSKDSANAGIVLVQSNPLSNLEALKKVVHMTNVKNKTSVDAISLVSQLFLESLLPAYRKLRSIEKRASDWKTLKASALDQATKDKVLAYWHFEDELKGYYGDFCNNLAQQLQHGKEPNKLKAIHATSALLIHSPEREIQLLPMLINKFGDPNRTVTNKLLETMRYLAKTHSRMCSVIAREVEKLLFRNNTTERGQHYALAFLSLMARYCDTATARVLVRICLAFFKIKTELGAVNTRTMQRILACFRAVITEAVDMSTVKKEEDLIDGEVLEQLYRMIYLAQIETALFAISLLLELNLATKMRSSDRYYTMVYKKMGDLEITKAKHSNINLYFNILHRSIVSDPNTTRAQAFVKRLLQIGLYWPSNKACGALIMISKILRRRPAIRNDGLPFYDKTNPEEDDKSNVKNGQHAKTNGYDPRHRNPLFAGAQYSLKYELGLYREHFHPTVRLFAEDMLNGKPMSYYGDPIEDFHLTRFLDRFSFKNPAKRKAVDPKKLQGSRKLAVKDLNDQNVVEEEKFLLQ
jgi:ribosome biogenesis protein MAK21